MTLRVELPLGYFVEQNYVARCLFGEFLGLDYETHSSATEAVRVYDDSGRELLIAADLFLRPRDTWLTTASLPREPIAWWDASEIPAKLLQRNLPVLYGRPSLTRDGQSIRLDVDLFGGCFFYLSRIEEVVRKDRDRHSRFPGASSLSVRLGLLHRPIVDEYVEVLWACLQALWPTLRRRPRTFRQNLTHDVDLLRYSLIRAVAGNLKRRKLVPAAESFIRGLSIKAGQRADPYDTFQAIMDLSESIGVSSAFYFITQWTHPIHDFGYVFDRPGTRALLRSISTRGHEIGLHGSYNSYADGEQLAREFATLKRVCSAAGVRQERWGGRQHFLRWRTPDTFQNWQDAGLDYDSTLGYADAAGFRCGTCHQFPAFNVETGQTLRVIERPLIAMEGTVMDASYQNLGATTAALDRFKALKDVCRYYDGEFTLLWHNNRLVDQREIVLYSTLIAA
jgi:peptidoglycan/xylan/chitin deacetylase (PgdA/CDA1 family)